ncbi:hypothetical protein Tco_1519289, partial [Tanacetum coccineum]
MSSITAQQTKLDLELVLKRKGLRLENAMEGLILERNNESLQFKLSWMLLLSLHAILHFLSLQMFLKCTCTNSGILSTNMKIPTVHGQNFDALPTDEDIVSFFKELSHTREIKSIIDVVVDQMHQPWRTFAIIINKSLSGKTTGLDKLPLPEEPIRKSKRVKRPAKKSFDAPTTGIVIRETPVKSLSKKKEKMTVEKRKGIDFLYEVALTEEAQYEEVRTKSLRDFHKTYPSGSGTVTKLAPSAAKIKPSVTNEGTSAKPGVPDVTEEESTESEAESWGRDEDDSNNDRDSRSEGSDQERDSDDDNTQSDSVKGSDSEHDTDENETGSESDQQEVNEEDVEDDEEEKDDELVKTPSNS